MDIMRPSPVLAGRGGMVCSGIDAAANGAGAIRARPPGRCSVRGSRLLVALLWLVGSVGAALAQPPPASLAVGDVAPAFALPGTDGKTVSLADYRGVKPVVLAWFPTGPIRD